MFRSVQFDFFTCEEKSLGRLIIIVQVDKGMYIHVELVLRSLSNFLCRE